MHFLSASIKPCRNRMHDRSLESQHYSPGSETVIIQAILTNCIFLFVGHIEVTGVAIPNTHAFAQWTQFAIVFLVFPYI